MARKITFIPQTINPLTQKPKNTAEKRKVAGYARVSTDQDEQLTSYEAQVNYYTNYITKNPEWEFVGLYADEGISGTSTTHRSGFRQMIDDALAGKIDLIITKSVSRFARNTVDSLTTIRKLKEHHVECYFEKENIWTFDGKGELLLTIMSSIAQEESRSISENVTWGHRKRMQDGKVSLPYSNFLGYKKGADGLPEIVPEEAETVRFIYRSFLEGMTPYNISKALMEREILSPGGKKKWCASTVQSILKNEKYKGSAILQKQYTVDYLTKKTRKNEGQLPKYYIEESHEAIISPEEYELVQIEFDRRKKLGKHYSGTKTLGSKIVCSDCGGFFGSKVWHSTDKYRKVIWQCNQKFKKDCLCTTPTLNETEVKERFITAFGLFFQKRDIIISAVQEVISALSDFRSLDEKLTIAIEEMNYVTELHRLHVKNNRITAQNLEEYDKRSDELQKEYETKKAVYDKLLLKKNSRMNKIKALESLIVLLNQTDSPISEFDENLWHSIIEKVTVYPNKRMIFQFLDGTEIEA